MPNPNLHNITHISQFARASVDHPERNEDALWVGITDNLAIAPAFAAIDGMGGHQFMDDAGNAVTGREAAAMVRETVLEDVQHLPADSSADPGSEAERRASAALVRAHEQVLHVVNGGLERPTNKRVGAVATVVVLCEGGRRLLTAQVGDTRGYLFTDGDLIQICPDEDNIEYCVRAGLISDDDAAAVTDILNTHDGVQEPNAPGNISINGEVYPLYIAWRWFLVGNTALGIPPANVVLHALGIHPQPSTPLVSRIEIAPNDQLLLCSDGVYKNLSEAELIAHLSNGDTAEIIGEAAYARSLDTSNRRNTQDDVSGILVRFGE